LDTEKTKEELVTELDAARRRIAELESKAHTIRCSQWTRCSSRYESLVKLYELEIGSLQELFDFALEQALVLTESTLGYIYFYDETTEVFTLYSWSKNAMSHCKVADKPNRFLLKDTGLWGEVVRQRKEIVVNNFSGSNPFKKGYPEGHVDIHNFLSIPVWKGESIVAVVGVGNKESDYTEFDIQQLDLFAKGVWVVAQRKGAEEALRLSEERYRSVVEDQTELISRTTPEGIIIFVNEIYCRFFGITAGEIIGTNWSPVVAPDDIHIVQNILKTVSPDSPVVTIEIRVYNSLNEIRWMQFVNRASFDNNSNVIEIQSVGRDITERKEIEGNLRESELRWKFALEGSGDGIWDWDIANNTIFFSHQYNIMLGYQENEIGNTPIEWKQSVHPDDLEDCLDALHCHLRGETSLYEKEYRLRCKNGSYKWILSRGKVIQYDGARKPLRVMGTINDISERKKIEAIRDDVDKIMRHDLRSSLIGIVGLPDILLENHELTQKEREILRAIQDSGYKLLSMIESSVSIYRMEVGSHELNLSKINIIPVLKNVISGLSRKFKNSSISFKILMEDRIATEEEYYLLDCEDNFFYNMISNLVLNSLEASPPNETIYLKLSFSKKSLSIVNKGSVPLEIRDNFFEKYVTAGKKSGTGLGTYSAALIAKTHGWKIWLDTSIPNETTVTVKF